MRGPRALRGWQGPAAIAMLGPAYLMWLRAGLPAVPCMFRRLTGLKCPGCGITSMALCLSRLDFKGAYEANPFLAVTGIPLAACLAWRKAGRTRLKLPRHMHERAATVYIAALLIFGALRNIM